MTIDQLLELCKLANVAHFPQGVVVLRQDGGNFRAGIADKEGVPFYPYAHTTKTAEGALDDLKTHVSTAARSAVASKAQEAEALRRAVIAVEGAKR